MRIVLFGKNGQLGWELKCTLSSLGEIIAFDYEDLDLADFKKLSSKLDELKPDLIVNASAYTAVDRAETEQDLAMKVNGEAPGIIAEAARRSGAMLVHYSTDYVFDGTKGTPYVETDPAHPINVYGESKLAGEQAIQQATEAFLILRTSWVYSLRLQGGFVNKILQWSRQNETLRIVQDQTGSPTWARMLAQVTALLIARGGVDYMDYLKSRHGIYHLAGKGGVSRFDLAKAILRYDPHPEEQTVKRVEGALSTEFPTLAARPAYSVLDCERFEKTFGFRIPKWEESLKLAMGS